MNREGVWVPLAACRFTQRNCGERLTGGERMDSVVEIIRTACRPDAPVAQQPKWLRLRAIEMDHVFHVLDNRRLLCYMIAESRDRGEDDLSVFNDIRRATSVVMVRVLEHTEENLALLYERWSTRTEGLSIVVRGRTADERLVDAFTLGATLGARVERERLLETGGAEKPARFLEDDEAEQVPEFIEACASGDIDGVKAMREMWPELANCRHPKSRKTPLMVAAKWGRAEVVDELLRVRHGIRCNPAATTWRSKRGGQNVAIGHRSRAENALGYAESGEKNKARPQFAEGCRVCAVLLGGLPHADLPHGFVGTKRGRSGTDSGVKRERRAVDVVVKRERDA